jgi:hypothetical protein
MDFLLNNLGKIMTLDEFIQLLEKQEGCPESLPLALQAMWYEKKEIGTKLIKLYKMLLMLTVLGFMPIYIEKRATIVMLVTGIGEVISQNLKESFLKNGSKLSLTCFKRSSVN